MVRSIISAAEPQPKTKLLNLFTYAYLFLYGCVGQILTLPAAAIAIGGGVVTPIRHLWDSYYPLIAFVEERVIMPSSALTFMITVLLVLAEIKAQGQPGFPFKTHPRMVNVSFNSVVMYGLSCAAELVASGFDRTSVFVSIARLVQKHRVLKMTPQPLIHYQGHSHSPHGLVHPSAESLIKQ